MKEFIINPSTNKDYRTIVKHLKANNIKFSDIEKQLCVTTTKKFFNTIPGDFDWFYLNE